jgi:hypothetical protein
VDPREGYQREQFTSSIVGKPETLNVKESSLFYVTGKKGDSDQIPIEPDGESPEFRENKEVTDNLRS